MLAALLAAAQLSGNAIVDSATVARTSWREAGRAEDLATAYRAVSRAAAAWPTQPAYAIGRARLAARLDDDHALLAALRKLAGFEAGGSIVTDTAVRRRAATNAAVAIALGLLERRTAPLALSTTYRTLPDSTVFAEGIDADGGRRLFVASVRHRTIYEVSANGAVRDLQLARQPGVGAILGVRYDAARKVLWATTAALPQMEGFTLADSVIAALLRVRIADGAIERRWDLPPEAAGHTAGDLAVAASGDVWVTDSRAPVLYRLRRGADTLERLTSPLFRSLQGVAPVSDSVLYVADYSHGLLRVNPLTGAVLRLGDATETTSLGVDGIVWYRGSIIGVQNGLAPPRVVRFRLDAAGRNVVTATVIDRALPLADEPTIGTLVGNDFVYVANSQWEKYDDAGTRVPGTRLAPTVVLRLPLDRH
jgi:streptogramin lyase